MYFVEIAAPEYQVDCRVWFKVSADEAARKAKGSYLMPSDTLAELIIKSVAIHH